MLKKYGKEATEQAIKKAEAEALLKFTQRKVLQTATKLAGGVANVTAGTAVRTPLMPTSYSQFTQDVTPTVTGVNVNGTYQTQKGMTAGKAALDVISEVGSESTGGIFSYGLGTVGKILPKIELDKFLNSRIGTMLNTAFIRSRGVISQAGFNGTLPELGE